MKTLGYEDAKYQWRAAEKAHQDQLNEADKNKPTV
jgi:hypothetical protein